jgi:hypothetical protein
MRNRALDISAATANRLDRRNPAGCDYVDIAAGDDQKGDYRFGLGAEPLMSQRRCPESGVDQA